MTGIVEWAAARARMVLAFILLSLVVGGYAYSTLPKEGEPDIEIAIVITVFFSYVTASTCLFGDGLESRFVAKARLADERRAEQKKAARKKRRELRAAEEIAVVDGEAPPR